MRVAIQPFRGWSEEAGAEALLLVDEVGGAEPPVRLEGETAAGAGRAADLLDHLDATFWERDASTLQPSYVAGRSEEILGYKAEQLLSTPRLLNETIHSEDRAWVEECYRKAIASGTSGSCEYRARHGSGKTVWLRDIVRVRTDSEGTARKLAGVTVDISAQKQQGEQAVQTEKMAALSRLASKVTHDCNNLLMIMSGYGEELLSDLPADSPSRNDVQEILAATERLSKITGELLTFTRRPMLLPKVISVNSVIEELDERLRRAAGDRVVLRMNLAPGLAQVNVDPEALANSVLRLTEHSRDAAPEGGRVTIETANVRQGEGSPRTAIAPGDYVTVAISDSGPALDEETRTRLFEPFYTGPRAGRGLPGVYSVIKNSGGDVAVSSGPEGGAIFTIYLPWADAPVTREERVSVPAPEVPAPKVMETVLVVEDEDGIRALMRKILQKQGYQVLEASRGDEAIQVADRYGAPIHLLLTDVVMPKMSGRELAERMAAARPHIKVLFVSGYTDEDMLQDGPLPSGAAFLQKPFSLAALLEKTRSVLNGSSAG